MTKETLEEHDKHCGCGDQYKEIVDDYVKSKYKLSVGTTKSGTKDIITGIVARYLPLGNQTTADAIIKDLKSALKKEISNEFKFSVDATKEAIENKEVRKEWICAYQDFIEGLNERLGLGDNP